MFGLGTIINGATIIAGGLIGIFVGNLIKQSWQRSMQIACGVSVIFIGIAGALEKMFSINNNALVSSYSMMIVICLTIGTLIGEIFDIEGKLQSFGNYLKKKTGSNKDNQFVESFVNTSYTVCIGAMTIIGSINDGLYGDYSLLATKSVLDFVTVLVMCASSGKGAIFSFIPMVAIQAPLTILAKLLSPLFTELALMFISLIGSILIFCVGINLVFGNKIKVANMLPALIIAIIYSFF